MELPEANGCKGAGASAARGLGRPEAVNQWVGVLGRP